MEYLQSHHKLSYHHILRGREQKDKGGDFNKRLALQSFDNSIELSITIYLSYYYKGSGLTKSPSKMHFHEKIRELMNYISIKSLKPPFTEAELLDFHSTRNKIYHEAISILPTDPNLEKIDEAAEWIFREIFNFDYPNPFEEWGTSFHNVEDRNMELDVAPKLEIIQHPKSRKINRDKRAIVLTLTKGNGDHILVDVISNNEPIISVTDGTNNALKIKIERETSQHIELIGYFTEGIEQEIVFTFSFEDEYLGEKRTRSFKRTIKHTP